ncbi:MAG: hypothetical protein ACJAQ3_000262 [Planctomycetota bacterium]|jgi:hypothetical protein
MEPLFRSAGLIVGVVLCALLASCVQDTNELESIQISPATGSIAAGTQQSFVASGLMTNGESVDLTSSVAWSSSDVSVASVAGGMAVGLLPGMTTVRATNPSTGIRGAAVLTVTNADLVSLAMTPPTPQVALGTSVQLTVIGTFSDSTVQDLTATVTWSSSEAAVATVAAGLAQSNGVGTSTITAAYPGTSIEAFVLLTVTEAVLSSIAITPPNASIALGTSLQMTAMGTFSDATTQDLTASVTWASANLAVASVNNAPGSEGLASSVGTGTVTITATDPGSGVNGATSLTVTAATLVSMAVTPANPSVALGTDQQFVATGTYTDASTQDLTTSVTWSSAAPGTATISNAGGSKGLASSVATGTAAITAADPGTGVNGSTSLTVTPAALVSIDVTPTNPSIALGTDRQFAATGTYTDASTQDLTTSVTWSSAAAGTATISNAGGSEGLASSVATGTVTITATDPGTGVDGSTSLTVTAAALVSMGVTPTNPSIALGTDQLFAATGTYTDSSTQDLTTSVTWSSTAPGTATISNAGGSKGLASSVGTGTTTITATDPGTGVNGSTNLTVTLAALNSIDVTPTNPSIALGTDQQFVAIGTYTDASTQDLTTSVTWSSAAPGTATISNGGGSEGLASSVGTGTASISAIDPGTGVNGSASLTVTPAVLVSITVTPPAASITMGSTEAYTATGTYSDVSTQDLTTSATWTSSTPATATVSNAGGSEGLATAVALGSTTITAIDSGSGVSGNTTLDVIADITFVAAGTAISPSALDLDVPTPAGMAESDIMIASIAIRPSSATITPPSGWVLVRRMDNAGGASNSLAVYQRVATASEPGTYRWSFSSSTGSTGAILAFRGVDVTAPVDIENGASTANATVHDAPSVTTTAARTMLVTAHAFSSAATWTPPAGMTEAVDIASVTADTATGIALEVNYELQTLAGATGSRAATASSNADTGNTHSIGLSPGP